MKTPICFSVISHGHEVMLNRLLSQINGEPELKGSRVVVTLNLLDEPFDADAYPSLDLRIVRNRKPKGFGANHNAAFLQCEVDWFAILNPDLSLIEQEPFTTMVKNGVERNHLANEKIGLIAPRILAADRTLEDSVRSNLTPCSLVRRMLGHRDSLQIATETQLGKPFFWLAGMCLLVHSTAYRAIGGFDERFFLYCEDFDLCARLYNAGWVICLEGQSHIIHEAQRDSHRSSRYLRMHLSSLIKVWISGAFWRLILNGFQTSK